jgi:hypothetical protein
MRYLTVSETLRRNGDRHAARAAAYLAAGMSDRAAGSMRKAKRNWARAKAFEPQAWTRPLIESLARQVAEQVLHGTHNR